MDREEHGMEHMSEIKEKARRLGIDPQDLYREVQAQEEQSIPEDVRRMMREAEVGQEEAEWILAEHEGDFEAALEDFREAIKHRGVEGGCYDTDMLCGECQQENEDMHELERARWEEDYEEYQRDREREEREYSRPY
ncbi:MAG: hypothetical protein M3R38_18695 [Actinomycetota bacterium]|nr:hypothetical protein [Actinomycetota bacterium]